MRRAVRLADRGWGRVAPNPLVGAVVVRDGVPIGEGWHREYGGPHAEVHAIEAAGSGAAGATLYVSLEPCSHHGRTPPCTEAILAAGIRRVVFGAADPNPAAAGGGSWLAARGVHVDRGLEAAAVRRQNAAFFHAHEHGGPWVALKLAQSLDGAIAATPGVRTQLTGTRAVAETHHLRAGVDAILVGVGTVLADDPLLTARGQPAPRVPPARVILDTRARTPVDARLVASLAEAPVHLVHAGAASDRVRALQEKGVVTHDLGAGNGGVAIDAALRALWDAGMRSILCEGGTELAASLLGSDRIERIYLFVAPIVLGPGALRGLVAPLVGRWRLASARRLGADALLVYDRIRTVEVKEALS